MSPTKVPTKLSERIKAAIHDGKLTQQEHAEILAIAHEDGRVDDQERKLLHELLHLVEHGSVKVVP